MRIFMILIVLCLIGGGIDLVAKINNQPVNQSELKQVSQSIEQTVSEGKLLALEASGSRTPATYTKEQA